MNHIKLSKEYNLNYPVGNGIKAAMKFTKAVVRPLKPLIKDKHINIWVRGSSGSILGTMLYTALERYISPGYEAGICHVKKESEESHSSYIFSWGENTAVDIIIDDFISSGNTVRKIFSRMLDNGVDKVDVLIVTYVKNNSDPFIEVDLGFTPAHLITGKTKSNITLK